MTKKKQFLQSLQGDWTAAHIIVSYKSSLMRDKTICKSEEAYELITNVWSKELISLQEQMMAFYLNRNHKLIGYRLISSGTMTSCIVDIKLLVSLALHCMATCVVIAHNHPSGNLKPSSQDIDITNKIKKALELIDVKLLDHLIISEDKFLSMTDEGLVY